MLGARRVSLGTVLGATVLTLSFGFLLKSPCLQPWHGQQYTLLCYSDIVPLFATEGLDRGLVPYLEAPNEYPVLTGFAMALAGIPADSFSSFFVWNAALLGALALVTAAALHRIAGGRALLFALAPTLAIYAFVNWDLVAVAAATAATLLYLRGRDAAAGALLGLGAAAKLYPALLVVAFAADRLRRGLRRPALALAGTAGAVWLAANAPIAALAPDRWSRFFRFNSARPGDWDTVWFFLQRTFGFPGSTDAVNVLSAASFAAVAALLWWAAWRRDPAFPRWTLGFPLLVAFLLTSKVYSPQFSLWLLPWFALALPDLRLFAAFSAADAAVFVTRFQYFARLEEVGTGVPYEAFAAALLLRAAVLILCLVAWVRRMEPAREPTPAPVREAVAP